MSWSNLWEPHFVFFLYIQCAPRRRRNEHTQQQQQKLRGFIWKERPTRHTFFSFSYSVIRWWLCRSHCAVRFLLVEEEERKKLVFTGWGIFSHPPLTTGFSFDTKKNPLYLTLYTSALFFFFLLKNVSVCETLQGRKNEKCNDNVVFFLV